MTTAMHIRRHSMGVVLLLFACGGGEEQVARSDRPRPLAAPVAPPAFSITLRAAGSTILEPSEVIETDSGLYLFASPDELWFAPFDGSDRTPRLAGSLRKFGQGAVFVLASHPDGIGVAGVDGRLRLMSYSDPTQLEYSRIIAQALNRPLGLSATGDGGWIVAHSRMRTWANRAAISDSTVALHVSASGEVERLWAFERVGAERPAAFLVDHMAATGLRDTLVIVGSSPARIILVTTNGVRVDTLMDVPARPLTEQDRSGLREVTGSEQFPHLRRAALPEAHFALLKARPIGRAMYAVARTGERRFVLDLYCDRRFRTTVLGDADILDIFPGQRGATVLHEIGEEGDVRLDFIPWDKLTGVCEP